MLKIIVKSYNHSILQFYLESLKKIVKFKDFNTVPLPSKKKKITLLRSPHVYKKAKAQYQHSQYSNVIYTNDLNVIHNLRRFSANSLYGISLKFEYTQ
jgi:ribosomal protein S10